jgi:hypothetical protein
MSESLVEKAVLGSSNGNQSDSDAASDAEWQKPPRKFFIRTERNKPGALKVLTLANAVEDALGRNGPGRFRAGPDGALYIYADGVYQEDGEESLRYAAQRKAPRGHLC